MMYLVEKGIYHNLYKNETAGRYEVWKIDSNGKRIEMEAATIFAYYGLDELRIADDLVDILLKDRKS